MNVGDVGKNEENIKVPTEKAYLADIRRAEKNIKGVIIIVLASEENKIIAERVGLKDV